MQLCFSQHLHQSSELSLFAQDLSPTSSAVKLRTLTLISQTAGAKGLFLRGRVTGKQAAPSNE